MEIFSSGYSIPQIIQPTSVALGYFDGVHLGHQAVLAAAHSYALQQGLATAAFTFVIPHTEGVKGSQIMSEQLKHRALAEAGVRYCFEPPFSEFQGMEPEEFFVKMIVGQFRAKAIACGPDYGFGAKRAGDIRLLQKLCTAHDVHLQVVPVTVWQGQAVSSSRIRAALQQGDITAVNAMLGRPYTLNLPVQHGQRLGSTLGFPTINQHFPEGMQPPAHGVYITETVINGVGWPSATGYGTRPTVNGQNPTCETFIVGFTGDLYGCDVEVRFYKRLADVRKFASPQELSSAVHQWAQQAEEYFKQKH